ncbi:MAG TPA: nicotinate (nicotinamide) nucleotide adenylyltransferase [bacterium]|nr:nicotinate (nicotinamide) nucleotide adenylyltransferase [bacterium]
MKCLVLGGSFNPIHLGHLFLGQEVAYEFGYNRVILVPSFIPPHKSIVDDPGADARLAMVRLAVSGDPLFGVEDCEIGRGGISYTIDTIDHINEFWRPSGKPGLVIGDDLVDGFGTWLDSEKLAHMCELIVARRAACADKPIRTGQLVPYEHRSAHNLILEISSTDIRARIASGKPWRQLVSEDVVTYIESHGLYGYRAY